MIADHVAELALLYYGAGVAWIAICVFIGAFKFSGEPIAAVLWIATRSAIWPIILYRLARDVSRGTETTDLSEY
jgi:divalent metal cation (Fe/Co/Zn/Cd) transporter